MFKTQLALENWKSKYKYRDEIPVETFKRVAKALASVEKDPSQWEEKFLHTLLNYDNIRGLPTGLKCTTGGRITANIGTDYKKATLLNCFVNGPVSGATISYTRKTANKQFEFPVVLKSSESPDCLLNIFLTILEQAKTLASEGGYGINFDFIRPRGSIIHGIGIRHPGIVSYMHIWDAVSECIVRGDNDGYQDKIKNYLNDEQATELKQALKAMARKGAMMGCLSVWHPDIEEFVRAKQTSGKLTKFNMSIVVDDKFMQAVTKDGFYDLHFNGEIKKRIKARDLYELIMESTYNRAEPGILFIDNMHRNNPIAYLGKANATNPCVIGTSIIAVADGRNGVAIKQLAEEGLDIPVYSRNLITGKVEIKFGRNSRKTGEKKEVWKLTLDDSSEFIATPDHKMLLNDGSEKQLKDLKQDDSLVPFNTYMSNGYRQISEASERQRYNGLHLSRRQYTLIYMFYNPNDKYDGKYFRIHHDNFDKTNDRPQFLKKCTIEEHKKFHDISGKNNPMFKLKDKVKYHENMSKATSGLKNGMAYQVKTQDMYNKYLEYAKEKGRRITSTEIETINKENNFPTYLRKFRLNQMSCTNTTQILDKLEYEVLHNHKVKKVEFYGYEDVYNMTVDDNHNFAVLTSHDEKFITSSGIFIKNCGEVPGLASTSTTCLLGSINLTQYVSLERRFDFEQYKEDILVFTRMLDNVNDLTTSPLPSYEWTTKNLRQIGMGLHGLGSALIMLGIPYNSKEAIEFTKKVAEIKENLTWQASAELAKEKGTFPAYDKEEFENTEYFKSDRLWPEIKDLIRHYGVRNAKTTTNPPLGNTSAITDNASNGIEPVYDLEYERKAICAQWPDDLTIDNVKKILKEKKEKDFTYWRGGYDGREYYFEPQNRGLCEVSIVRDYGYQWVLDNFPNENHDKYLITTKNLEVKDHVNIQAVAQYYCNQSISKTCNVPTKYPFKDFKDLYIEAWKKGLNGFTAYRDGSMESVLSSIERAEKKKEIIKKDIKLPATMLNGSDQIIKREGMKFYIHFSYLPDDKAMKYPIVIWIYTNSKGETVACNKAAKSLVKLAVDCGIPAKYVDETWEKAKEDLAHNKLGRMISLCLRHNVPREDIYSSLFGIEGDNISSLLAAVRKFIASTIEDGTKLKIKCECGSPNLIFQSNCLKCKDCGFSGCP